MKLPTFKYEKELWKRDFRCAAGIDEVGRGCFAGPVVAATVVFAKNSKLEGRNSKDGKKIIINDSKKLSAKQRDMANKWIKENALSWGIGEASAVTINRVGIVKATEMAFRRAIVSANERLVRKSKGTIDFLLIDAFYVPFVKGLRRKNQKAIVRGDSLSISIGAASIIAKVYRDHKMETIGTRKRYKKYDWISNKGYGTKKHLSAIVKHGTNGYHRRQFVNTYLSKGVN